MLVTLMTTVTYWGVVLGLRPGAAARVPPPPRLDEAVVRRAEIDRLLEERDAAIGRLGEPIERVGPLDRVESIEGWRAEERRATVSPDLLRRVGEEPGKAEGKTAGPATRRADGDVRK